MLRNDALSAIVTLDACRGLVHALLSAGRELPDRVPAAGGGVA
jgi:hypothetical protein